MSFLKKSIVFSCIVVVILLLVFAYLNWSMWEYKYGSKPVIINYLTPTEDEHRGDTFVLHNPSRKIKELKIGLTDFYYVEAINQLSFGIWYKNWEYSTTDKVFHISIRDNNGNIYESYSFSILPSVGVFETFQIREIRGIEIKEIDSFVLDIRLDSQETESSFEIFYNNVTNKLKPLY